MRKDKELAFSLRKQGKTYREIEKEMNVSRGTLSAWFKGIEWSRHLSKNHTESNIKLSTERIQKLNEGRKKALENKYRKNEIEAVVEYEVFKKHPLFMAGLMLYAGEGDRRDIHVTRLSNVDFLIHKIFINFCLKFFKIPKQQIKLYLLLYPDLDIDLCIQKWSQELGVERENFHKPQVIQGREKKRRLHFGVGSTIISSTTLKKKLIKWIELSKEELSKL